MITKSGQICFTEQEILDELYKNPEFNFDISLCEEYKIEVQEYNTSKQQHYDNFFNIDILEEKDIVQVDQENQQIWYMPDEYKNMDIAEYIIKLCKTDEELQRVGEELLLFQEKNMFNVLKYLKFFVDHMRNNNKFIGVGRGSSVSSYVLYLLGVHKINSMYYDLDVKEFLR